VTGYGLVRRDRRRPGCAGVA